MSDSTSPTDLDFLIDHGRELSNLMRKAKTRPVEAGQHIPTKVANIITNIIHSINKSSAKSGFAKESILKLMNKVQGMLEEFIKYDSENKSSYQDLVNAVSVVQYGKPSSSALSPCDSSNADFSPQFDSSDEFDFESELGKLTAEDLQRLCCFLLFPVEAEIKKREIIHCWVGMGLTDSFLGEGLLATLVASGFIERKILNKKLFNRYKMPGSIRTRMLNEETNVLPQIKDDGSWSILLNKQKPSGHNEALKRSLLRNMTMATASLVADHDNVEPEALLNVNQGNLNATRFKTISGMHKLKVVHLGSWQQDSKKYIVAEDVEAFKYLKSLSLVAFLSLEGVSGMLKLPESVYELQMLKVLDLRGCNNLEQLPDGIKSLRNLTHLDLSGCYLLDHIPLGITFLTSLQVLKGFIINTDDYINLHNTRNAKGKQRKKRSGLVASSPCPFTELRKLNKLQKLTLLTRRMDFPLPEDFHTLCIMEQLSSLRIAWAGSSVTQVVANSGDDLGSFPVSLTKLELQAAPEGTVSRLLRLISVNTDNCSLEKLYIRGGGLRLIEHFFGQPMVMRLRYLPQLQIHWDDFIKLFPNLGRLEILGCPNLIAFPCDENGVWELGY